MKRQPSIRESVQLTPLPKSAAAATRASGDGCLARDQRHAKPDPVGGGPGTLEAPSDEAVLDAVVVEGGVADGRRPGRLARDAALRRRGRPGRAHVRGHRQRRATDAEPDRPGDLDVAGVQRRAQELHLPPRGARRAWSR